MYNHTASYLTAQIHVQIFTSVGSVVLAVDGLEPNPNPKFDAPNKSSSSSLSNNPPSLATGFFFTGGALGPSAAAFYICVYRNYIKYT